MVSLSDNPCKDCTNRNVGCHGKCDKYISWQQAWRAQKEDILAEKAADSDVITLKEEWRNRVKVR